MMNYKQSIFEDLTIIFNYDGITGEDLLNLNLKPNDKITTYIHNSELYGNSSAKLLIKADNLIILDMDMNDYFNESWATKDLLERDIKDIANDCNFNDSVKERLIEFFTITKVI